MNGRGRAVAYGSYLGSRHKVRPGYLLAHYLSSHDEPMALYNLNNDKARFRICAAIQMTSLGLPVIYYGEEVARAGSEWPLNRTDMPWGERDIKPGKGAARDEAMRDFYKIAAAYPPRPPRVAPRRLHAAVRAAGAGAGLCAPRCGERRQRDGAGQSRGQGTDGGLLAAGCMERQAGQRTN